MASPLKSCYTDRNKNGGIRYEQGFFIYACAKENDIPYQMESFIGRTGSDADKIHFAGEGIVTALLSLPLRYMHSPSEVCHFDDMENAIELLAEFLCRIDEKTDIDPFI